MMQPTSAATVTAAGRPAASFLPADEKKDEQTDDFAALFAASWFVATVPLPPAQSVDAPSSSGQSMQLVEAAPSCVGQLPAPLNDIAPESLGAAEAATEAATISSLQLPAVKLLAFDGGEVSVNSPGATAVTPTPSLPEDGTNFIESSAKKLLQNSPDIEEVLADGSSRIDSDGLLSAEAARRDSISVASALAETGRHTRPPLSDWLLKPLFAKREGVAPENAADAVDPGVSPAQPVTSIEERTLSAGIRTSPAAEESAGRMITQSLDAIIAVADNLARRETRSIRLRLHPEELGQMEIEIGRDAGGKLSARLTVESEAARQILTGSIGQLREALERAGFSVDRLDVSAGHSGFQSHTGGHAPHDQSQQQPGASSFTGTLAQNERAARDAAPRGSTNPAKQADKFISLRA